MSDVLSSLQITPSFIACIASACAGFIFGAAWAGRAR